MLSYLIPTSMRAALALAVSLPLLLSACGDEKEGVPEVVGKRLDVALADFKDAGYGDSRDDVEILGGGMFGVVDDTNWYVCEQDPAAGEVPGGNDLPRVSVERSCEGARPTEEPEPSPEPSESAEKPSASPSPTEPAKDAPETSDDELIEETFTMPAVIGESLQEAQDELQDLGSFIMVQTDATGRGRPKLLDSNWKVCTQDPKPGKSVPLSTVVELAAVKLNEACP